MRVPMLLAGGAERAPRQSAARTAGSAGLRWRNAQLGWAVRRQDPLPCQKQNGDSPQEEGGQSP